MNDALDKSATRAAGRAARAAATDVERQAAARRLADGILTHPLLATRPPGAILVPSHHRDEIDTGPLAHTLEAAGWILHRPRTRPDHTTIEAVPWPTSLHMAPGYAGIPEPPLDAPAADPWTLAIVLVPGTAFARDGARVGTGWGYFDRFLGPLVGARGPVPIGVGFRAQLFDHVPTQPHDVPMQGLQLEDVSIVCRPRP